MNDRQYLEVAEKYATAKNQYSNFVEVYRHFREFFDVRTATENALFHLFGRECPLVTSI